MAGAESRAHPRGRVGVRGGVPHYLPLQETVCGDDVIQPKGHQRGEDKGGMAAGQPENSRRPRHQPLDI